MHTPGRYCTFAVQTNTDEDMTGVIYARVSSTSDRQSTARQVSDLNDYANRNDIKIVRIFEEHISGAKANEERPILCECLDYAIAHGVSIVLISELSRLGRNVFEVLENVKRCKDNGLNIFFQKENLAIFLPDGKPNPLLAILISVLGTCAQLERENIQYRLNSGRARYIENGGKLGRKPGSVKSRDDKAEEYKNVIRELRRGTSIRRTAKLCDVSVSTVQRVKAEFGL